MNATKTKPKAAPRLRKLPQGYVFKPVVDEKGRRRFDKELVLLLRTRSDNYKILQTAWQNDPDVIAWATQANPTKPTNWL